MFRLARTRFALWQLKIEAVLCFVVSLGMMTGLLVPGAQASPRSISASELAFTVDRYPGRLTGSEDSEDFLLDVSQQLRELGWAARIQSYETIMQTHSGVTNRTTFVSVHGKNLFAHKINDASDDAQEYGFDLLIVAPYDIPACQEVFTESEFFTTQAAAGLLRFAENYEGNRNVALALVSGHYQLGAGMRALVEDLGKGGRSIGSILVIGDMYGPGDIPLVPNKSTPTYMAEALSACAGNAGLNTFLAGEHSYPAWFRAATLGPPVTFVGFENIVDDGTFSGEASMVGDTVPAITLGLPTDNKFKNTTEPVDIAAIAERTQIAANLLIAFADLQVPQSSNNPKGGLTYGESTPITLFNKTYMLQSKTLLYAGLAGSLLAVLFVLLAKPNFKRLGGLGWVIGATAAALIAQSVRTLAFKDSFPAYIPWTNPAVPNTLIVAVFLLLAAVGVLRMWAVRSRIANLPRASFQVNTPGDAAAGGAGSSPPRNSAASGIWGLSVMAVLSLAAGAAGSQNIPHVILALAGLAFAVVIESLLGRRNSKPPAAFLWVRQALYLTPLVPAAAWMKSHVWTGFSLGNLAACVCLGVASGSFLSTMEPPKPVGKNKVGLLNMATLAAPLIIVAAIIAARNSGTAPISARVNEVFDYTPEVEIYTTKPVKDIAIEPYISGAGFSHGLPSLEPSAGLKTGALRFRFSEEAGCSWAKVQTQVDRETSSSAKGSSRTVILTEADWQERPTLVSVEVKDMPVSRGRSEPFVLENLAYILESMQSGETTGTISGFSREDQITPKTGYAVRFVWWHPSQSPVSAKIVALARELGTVNCTASAHYLGRTYVGQRLVSPSTPRMRITNQVIVKTRPL